jgi:hypothetical protein
VGANSHRPDINEGQKKWTIVVTEEGYDFATLTRKEYCEKHNITEEQYDKYVAGMN